MGHHLKWIYPCWCDGATIASSNKKRLYRLPPLTLETRSPSCFSRNKMKLLPHNTFMWSFDTAYSRHVLVESNLSWLSLAASIRLVEKNWQQLVYQNENWKREKNWTVCTRIFGWIWLTWSGSVLKFSFQLRPAVCQNLIDTFHVLRNIQFNSDIKRPQCHWTLILISINMIVIGEDAAAFITLYSGHVTRLRHPRHLQPRVPSPAHTSVMRNTRVITELSGPGSDINFYFSGSCIYIKQACYVYFDAT